MTIRVIHVRVIVKCTCTYYERVLELTPESEQSEEFFLSSIVIHLLVSRQSTFYNFLAIILIYYELTSLCLGGLELL